VKAGTEGCDDGNTVDGDGFCDTCAVKAGTEGCDDGNRVDGDGCSSACAIENFYVCNSGAACSNQSIASACSLRPPWMLLDLGPSTASPCSLRTPWMTFEVEPCGNTTFRCTAGTTTLQVVRVYGEVAEAPQISFQKVCDGPSRPPLSLPRL
ncbi:hypothetical protein T484DRAFT_1833043, partial [Baffinella frigidus]